MVPIVRANLKHEWSGQDSPPPSDPPVALPPGWLIAVDSNEAASNHHGYEFPSSVTRPLRRGDYSLVSPAGVLCEDHVVVERKSLPNLLGEVTNGRARWEKALAELAGSARPHLVVECSWSRLSRGRFRFSAVKPDSVQGSLIAWCHRYRVMLWLAGSRLEGQRLTRWILHRAATDLRSGFPQVPHTL